LQRLLLAQAEARAEAQLATLHGLLTATLQLQARIMAADHADAEPSSCSRKK
jgi:hypothetical protein